MPFLGKLLQWLVSGLAGFITLSGLLRLFFTGDVVFPLLGLVSLLIVFPPFQPILEKRLPLLRPIALKIVLSLVVLFGSLIIVSSTAPSIKSVALCPELTGGQCAKDNAMIVQNVPKLYLTAIPNQLRNGTKVKLDLTAIPEPGTSKLLSSSDTQVKINNGIAQFEVAPARLPIGAYEVSLFSEDKAFFKVVKPFTVWNSQQEIDQRLAKNLKSQPTKLKNVKLCQSSDEKECPAENLNYKGKVTALTVSADVQNAVDGVEVTYTWRLISLKPPVELMKRTRSLKKDIGYLNYTLTNQQGFDPGTYEVVINLETSNAVPIRKEFAIQ